jgi:hypothetical protein
MRSVALLAFCVVLTACVIRATTLENRDLTGSSPQPIMQSTAFDVSASSMPLYLWSEDRRRYEIHLINLTTGEDVLGHPPFVVSENTEFTGPNILSVNGQQLAIVAAKGEYCYPTGGGTACMGRADVLHMINRRAWQDVTAPLPGKGWAGPMSFSSNGRHLALILNEPKISTVMLFDTSAGKLIAQQEIAFHPSVLGYTDNGAIIVLFGQPLGSNPGISKPDSPRVVLMDATTLEVKWEQKLPNILSGYWCLEKCDASHDEQTFADWTPAVILSPDRERLYIVHADEQQLTTVYLDTRTVHTIEIQKVQSWFDKLLALTAGVARAKGGSNGVFKAGVLSPDGRRLYVIGQMMSTSIDADSEHRETRESLGLDVIEVDSGRKLSSIDGEAMWIKITPDGARLLLGNWGQGRINILDTASLKSVADLAQWDIVVARGMNSLPMILASQSGQSLTRLAILDPVTFNIVGSWSMKTSYASWISTP